MPPKNAKVTLSVVLDGEQADIDIDQSRTVGDLIKHALMSFGMHEQDPDECHLAALDRLYFPNQPLTSDSIAGGDFIFSLRLPL